MPPPPDPPKPQPEVILGPEFNSLEGSLKVRVAILPEGRNSAVIFMDMQAMVVKTAKIFKYHNDISKMFVMKLSLTYLVLKFLFPSGVQRHVPRTPRSLATSLATELARYDQICDSLESQLVSFI